MREAPSHRSAAAADSAERASAVAEARVGEAAGRLSKTALKKRMHELQSLGEALAELPPERFARIEMDGALRDAIEMLRRTRSHEGRRRQSQYVGKLMRHSDAEPLREAVAAFELGSAKETLALHRIETWRQDLIADDRAVTRWMVEHPSSDAKTLRELVRSVRAEAGEQASAKVGASTAERRGRAYRRLFQFIKPHVDDATAADGADAPVGVSNRR